MKIKGTTTSVQFLGSLMVWEIPGYDFKSKGKITAFYMPYYTEECTMAGISLQVLEAAYSTSGNIAQHI